MWPYWQKSLIYSTNYILYMFCVLFQYELNILQKYNNQFTFSSSNKSKSLQNTNINRYKESLHIICKQALSVARF